MWEKVSWPDVKANASLGSVTGLVRDIRQIAASHADTHLFRTFKRTSTHHVYFSSGNRFVSFKRCSV